MSERVVMVARLKPDAFERAEELATADELIGPASPDLRYVTFLSPSEIVFVVDGEDAEARMRDWFNDPARSTAISPWLALFDGPLHAAREIKAQV